MLSRSELVRVFHFFNGHVFKFAGLEDVATFFAFHVFGIFVAGNDLDTGMFALIPADFPRGLRRLARRHTLPTLVLRSITGTTFRPKMAVF